MSEGLENTEKSIYPQFGRFRWPESADLTKSENFIFFNFLRSFFVHFLHCNFYEYQNLDLDYYAENDHFTSISFTRYSQEIERRYTSFFFREKCRFLFSPPQSYFLIDKTYEPSRLFQRSLKSALLR